MRPHGRDAIQTNRATCSCNRGRTDRKHKHVPVLLYASKNNPLFDPETYLNNWFSLVQDFCLYSLLPTLDSPALPGGRRHQEEYDRCERDIGTFERERGRGEII